MGDEAFDVVVVGGGAAGVAAAVGAAEAGARTCLVEAAGALGGAAAMRNVLTYCGLFTLGQRPQRAVRGVADRVIARLQGLGGISGPHRHRGVFATIDPEAAKLALDEVSAAAGVTVLLHALVTGAERVGDRVEAITWTDHAGAHRMGGRAFVDASGEADLAWLAGAAIRYGNDGQVNLGTLGTRFGGVAQDADISAPSVTAAIEAARARGEGPFTKDRSVVVRLPISGDVVTYLASADYDARDARSPVCGRGVRAAPGLGLSFGVAPPAGLGRGLPGGHGTELRHPREPAPGERVAAAMGGCGGRAAGAGRDRAGRVGRRMA